MDKTADNKLMEHVAAHVLKQIRRAEYHSTSEGIEPWCKLDLQDWIEEGFANFGKPADTDDWDEADEFIKL